MKPFSIGSALFMAMALSASASAATPDDVDTRLQAMAAKINAQQPGNSYGRITSAVAGHQSITMNFQVNGDKPLESDEQGRAEVRQMVCGTQGFRAIGDRYGITFHMVFTVPNWPMPLNVTVTPTDCGHSASGSAPPTPPAAPLPSRTPATRLAAPMAGSSGPRSPIADGGCSAYVGQTTHPSAFVTIAGALATLPRKRGEYESSQQFADRIASATNGQPSLHFMSVPLISDGGNISYDADAQVLSVHIWAVVHGHIAWWKALAPYADEMGLGVSGRNIDAVISQTASSAGSYVGTNAFGAKVRIQREVVNTNAIFERKSQDRDDLFFSLSPDIDIGANSIIAKIPVDPANARRLKGSLKAVFVIKPKWPFLVHGPVIHSDPTFDNPVHISETVTGVIADVKCALITDGNDKVLAAITTR